MPPRLLGQADTFNNIRVSMPPNTVFHRVSLAGLNQALHASDDKRSSLMNYWFYSTIGFGSAAEIQEGNENVV